MSFENIIGRLLDAEGGFSDHPGDKGGPTNYGITLSTLSAYRKTNATREEIKNLTIEEAKAIYKSKYWNAMNLDLVKSESIQLCLFDQGVNRGTKTAVIQAQQVLNMIGYKLTTVDGDLGPITAKNLNEVLPLLFCREYMQSSEHAYVNIVKKNQSQIVFLSGWLNRVHAIQDIIFGGGLADLKPVKPVEEKDEDTKSPTPLPPWYIEAKKQSGKKETDSTFNKWLSGFWGIVGLKHFKTIVGTSFAWCGLFVATMLYNTGVPHQSDGAGAKNWAKYGQGIDYKKNGFPAGAIIQLNNGAGCGSGKGNHVTFSEGFCTAEHLNKKGATFDGYGGNQGNQVKVSTYQVSKICAVRWPKEVKVNGKLTPTALPPKVTKDSKCTSGKDSKESTR